MFTIALTTCKRLIHKDSKNPFIIKNNRTYNKKEEPPQECNNKK